MLQRKSILWKAIEGNQNPFRPITIGRVTFGPVDVSVKDVERKNTLSQGALAGKVIIKNKMKLYVKKNETFSCTAMLR